MKLSEMFPSKYATGSDLNGRAVNLTIEHVIGERMRANANSPEETKYVLYLAEAKKGVILSRVLARQIGEALGSEDTDNWKGKMICLYPEKIQAFGAEHLVIRARAAQLQPAGDNGSHS